MAGKEENKKLEEYVRPVIVYERALSGNEQLASTYNQSGYEPLNLENVSFLNSDNFDATDLRF